MSGATSNVRQARPESPSACDVHDALTASHYMNTCYTVDADKSITDTSFAVVADGVY